MALGLLQPPQCVCFNVRRAARKVTQIFDKAMKPAGVQVTQFTLLAVLAGGGEGEGISMTSLASRLGMDRTTLTRNLAIVERAAWVTVRPGEDRRERIVTLTAAGRMKIQAALPYWRTAQERMLKLLGRPGMTELLALTRRIDAN